MKTVFVITHSDVVIDPNVPVPRWPLSKIGRKRIERLLSAAWLLKVTAVYSSNEQKAIDGARMLANYLELEAVEVDGLEEVDRSSTGYLPQEAHDHNAQMLFLHPTKSVDGWERAIDAQKRIVNAVEKLLIEEKTHGDLIIVTHGAVGSFLNSYLKNNAITLADAPDFPGGGGIFAFNAQSKNVLYDWMNIDNVAL
ncbi:MAG: histidine phosphatase family protein [Chloroflexota bacterium]